MIKLFSDIIAIRRRFALSLIVPALCLISAIMIVVLDVSTEWQEFWNIVQITGRSLIQTLITLGIFFLLFYAVTLSIALVISRYWRNPKIYGIVITVFLIVLLVLNSFPILYYLYLFDEHLDLKNSFMALYSVKIGSLIFANAMLYYVFSEAVFEMIKESEELYLISAEYKNTSVANYIKEKMTWIILSSLGSIFYYLFSFTLFTDLFLEGYASLDESQMGIIGELFTIIAERGWTTAAWLGLFIMLTIVLFIRLVVCQLPLWVWMHRRNGQTAS